MKIPNGKLHLLMDNKDRNNEGVKIPERITALQSLDSRLDEVTREMAADTRRSERTSSGALRNGNMLEDLVSPGDERESDCESGSYKSDSSSSGDSDVDAFQDYLGDEGQGCNAGTPEDLSAADANYDESGVPEDKRGDIPWLSELCQEVYEGVTAKVIDGGDIKLTRERFESPWRPFKSLAETAMMTLCRAHMPSRRFLRGLWKVLKLRHKRQDGTLKRFNTDDLPESPDHFVSDTRRGLPLMKAY